MQHSNKQQQHSATITSRCVAAVINITTVSGCGCHTSTHTHLYQHASRRAHCTLPARHGARPCMRASCAQQAADRAPAILRTAAGPPPQPARCTCSGCSTLLHRMHCMDACRSHYRRFGSTPHTTSAAPPPPPICYRPPHNTRRSSCARYCRHHPPRHPPPAATTSQNAPGRCAERQCPPAASADEAANADCIMARRPFALLRPPQRAA